MVGAHPSVRSVQLVGSRAEGRATARSDWDFLIGTHDFSHVSPVATEQSCMSLHRFGVTNVNAGSALFCRSDRNAPLLVVPDGTSQLLHAVRIPV